VLAVYVDDIISQLKDSGYHIGSMYFGCVAGVLLFYYIVRHIS